jgi:hypothetical protein
MDPDPLTADVVGRTLRVEEEADAEAEGARIAGEAPVALVRSGRAEVGRGGAGDRGRAIVGSRALPALPQWTPETKARMRDGVLAPALLVRGGGGGTAGSLRHVGVPTPLPLPRSLPSAPRRARCYALRATPAG